MSVKEAIAWGLRKATRLVARDDAARFDLWRDWVARWDLRDHECLRRASTPRPPRYSFLVAHKDCPEFLDLCVRAILRHAGRLDMEVIVADDGSESRDLSAIAALDPRVAVHAFREGRGHPQALQWLWYRARGEFAVLLDQDALLLGDHWDGFESAFASDPALLLVGVRDECRLRGSPEMLHPSFILAHKRRCDARLGRPLFFGPKPGRERYRFAPEEDYYAFFCKALAHDPRSIRYLPQHATRYGFGTVTHLGSPSDRVIYHQWYSGRTHAMPGDALVDGLFRASELREATRRFLADHRDGTLDLSPVTLAG